MKRKTSVVILILIAAIPFRTVVARSVEDRREVQGRALFAKGDYQGALDIYANLFAEKGDPLYLRNIGRCYQNLEEPQKAIKAFREYLRRAHVKSDERAEVEGFIKDMEDLEKQKAATTPPRAEPSSSAGPSTDNPPAAPTPQAINEAPAPAESSGNSAPGAVLTTQGSTGTEEEPSSITSHWWFWTGIAVLVAGGAAAAILLTRPHAGTTPPCPLSGSMGECL